MFRSRGLVNLQIVAGARRGWQLRGNCCHNITSLTIAGRVKHSASALQDALIKDRHFALVTVVGMPLSHEDRDLG